MARNEEKAQSMLYRFREAQAAELGMATRQDRRPRMASSCQDIRQCERWRGEILREISRKVSKITDPGLTDYEVRDLNDEINKLLREKSHWETQIINLGGANYRRAGIATTDAEGRTIPGQRGYKYFGRAKELPGVKELFEGAAREQEELEALKRTDEAYKAFKDQGPAYFGDGDEDDGELLKTEQEEENEGWTEAFDHLKTVLSLPPDASITPPLPIRHLVDFSASTSSSTEDAFSELASATSGKRKPSSVAAGEKAKKARSADGSAAAIPAASLEGGAEEGKKNGWWIVLEEDDLKMPVPPTKSEVEKIIMGLQKAALLKEYLG